VTKAYAPLKDWHPRPSAYTCAAETASGRSGVKQCSAPIVTHEPDDQGYKRGWCRRHAPSRKTRPQVPSKAQIAEQARQARIAQEEAVIKAERRVLLAAEAWQADYGRGLACEREIAELTAAVDDLRAARGAVS